jgi:hypothetical protein
MTTRAAFLMVITLSALAGCSKSSTAHAIPGTGPATTAVVTDYRTLDKGGIEIIIADKTGSPVTLKPAGPNKYTGTRQVPGDTMRVPVTVTVEEKQIVIETTGGGLTQRQVITAHEVKDDLR